MPELIQLQRVSRSGTTDMGRIFINPEHIVQAEEITSKVTSERGRTKSYRLTKLNLTGGWNETVMNSVADIQKRIKKARADNA